MFISRRLKLILLTSCTLLALTLTWRLWQPQPAWPQPVQASYAQAVRGGLTTAEIIANLQAYLQQQPDDSQAEAMLGLSLLQQVRETGDSSFYPKAEQALNTALQHDSQQIEAVIGQGLLALARHDFRQALVWGQQVQTLAPHRAQAYGIIGDAHIELGQYDDAAKNFQRMIDLRPDLNSYSRVSYLRELHGDMPGAIEAMQQAVNAGFPTHEGTLWAQVQLGHLYFNQGKLAQAEAIYRQALKIRPNYLYAQAGLARLDAARGQFAQAETAYQAIVARLPLPEFVIALGEIYEADQQPQAAQQQYELVRLMMKLNASAGMKVDLEMALFEANHGSTPQQTVELARQAYQERPSIYGADALAWALYQAGDYSEAHLYSQEALHLETKDAMLYYHAAMIAARRHDSALAYQYINQALTINPYFSPLYAPIAKKLQQTLAK